MAMGKPKFKKGEMVAVRATREAGHVREIKYDEAGFKYLVDLFLAVNQRPGRIANRWFMEQELE